jgi:hypothetical protein
MTSLPASSVGRELAAARAGAGAGSLFELEQVRIGHPAGGVGTHALEDLLDGDVAVLEAPRLDGARVNDHAGDAEPDVGHRRCGDGLVAADEGDYRVEHVAPADELYGVRDQLAAHQARLHALRAHGYAVGDGDGVELHRGAAGLPDPLLDLLGEVAVVEVAGHGFDPLVRNPDYGLVQVLVREAHALEVGAGRRPVAAVEDGAALVTGVRGLHAFSCQLGSSIHRV